VKLSAVQIRVLAPVFAVSALLLAGCSGGTGAAPAAQESVATPSLKPSVDARAFESVVSQQAAALQRSQDGLDKLSCTAGSAGADPCSPLYVARTFEMQTIALTLDSASNPSAKTYLGVTPAKISDRYATTVKTAAAADAAGQAWSDAGCATSTSINCHGIAFKFDQAVAALQSDFDGWKPYL
jgi:hypothetical protein